MKLADAIRKGRTAHQHTVRSAPSNGRKGKFGLILRVIKWAGDNAKVGGFMRKTAWAGMPIFQVTLEERATCPATCPQWATCYGDNMFLAARHRANRDLVRAIRADCKALASKFPNGFVVRLHVLGDFFSVEYVALWAEMLATYPALRIYGYTHWSYATAIGKAVTRLVADHQGRVSILRSDKDNANDPLPGAYVVPEDSTAPHANSTVICPNETGKAASCGDCGLCMLGRVSVTFLNHSHAVTVAKSLASRRALAVLNS